MLDTLGIMAHTLWNEEDRRALDTRLARLRPDAKGLWGALDAPRMLCHVTELISRQPETWDVEVARFRSALNDLTKSPRNGPWAVHAAFGKLSGTQWGRLLYRHTDYHFKQFGV